MNLSNLFTVERDNVELNKEAKNISYLRKIFERDHGDAIYDSDAGGTIRVKSLARKEISYIYFTVNKEFFDNYDKRQRPVVIRKKVGLPDDWKPDELVLNAIKELNEDIEGVEDKVIRSFDDTFHRLSILLKAVNDSSDFVIEALIGSKADTVEKFLDQEKLITTARDNIKWALDASNNLKTAMKNIEELKMERNKKVRKVQKANRLETDSSIYKRREDDV